MDDGCLVRAHRAVRREQRERIAEGRASEAVLLARALLPRKPDQEPGGEHRLRGGSGRAVHGRPHVRVQLVALCGLEPRLVGEAGLEQAQSGDRPAPLRGAVHPGPRDRLHQPVQRESLALDAHQRVAAQLGEGIIEGELVLDRCAQRGGQGGGQLSEQRTRDPVGSEPGEEAQELGGDDVTCLERLEGELPGARDGGRVVEHLAAAQYLHALARE